MCPSIVCKKNIKVKPIQFTNKGTTIFTANISANMKGRELHSLVYTDQNRYVLYKVSLTAQNTHTFRNNTFSLLYFTRCCN